MIFGWVASLLIGIFLGLIGGGGSILTVPVLVYLFHIDPVLSTAYSLFIVGITAFFGAAQNFRKGFVDLKIALIFAIPSILAVFLVRRYLIPGIPEVILNTAIFTLTKNTAILIFFSAIMLLAAVSMIRRKKQKITTTAASKSLSPLLIVAEGLVVGTITGVVGAGGGFLIIPALVLLAKLPMKTAIGTSLLIIAAKSLIGFLGDVAADQPIDWQFLVLVSLLAIAGVLLGGYLSNFIHAKNLRSAFGWFVFIMGVFMIVKETLI